jgi:hypothetical protein
MLAGLSGLLSTSALPVVAERSGWSALPGARGVAADLDPHAELGGPPLDHAAGVSTLCIAFMVSSPVQPMAERKRGASASSRVQAAWLNAAYSPHPPERGV